MGRPADSTPPLDHWYYPFQICPEWAERNEEIFEVLKIRTSDPAGFDDEFFNFDSSNGEADNQEDEDIDDATDD